MNDSAICFSKEVLLFHCALAKLWEAEHRQGTTDPFAARHLTVMSREAQPGNWNNGGQLCRYVDDSGGKKCVVN